MSFFILAFLTSLITTLLVVRSASFHAWMWADTDFSGPQKFHTHPVPRIGGGVLVAVAVAGVCEDFTRTPDFDAIREAPRTPVVVDGRNLYEPETMAAFGLEYYCFFGRPSWPVAAA